MKAMLRNALVGGALFAQLLGGCAAQTALEGATKPTDGKADAISRLCADAGKPADCNICEVRDWYGDGECDDFCASPDPDCSSSTPLCSYDIPSPLGETSADLRAISGRARRVTFDDVDSLTEMAAEQIVAAVTLEYGDVADMSREEIFAEADAGEFFLEPLTLDSKSYDWVRFYAGDTEVGSVFEGGTTRAVASISDGEVQGCTDGTPTPTPIAGSYTCDYDTAHPFPRFSYQIDADSEIAYGSADIGDIPEISARQIFTAAVYQADVEADADFDVVFSVSDDDEFIVLRLSVDGAEYDWVRWWAGDTEVGVIFDADALSIVAEIGDQEILGCKSSER